MQPAATVWEVVHERVIVRSEPTTASKLVGCHKKGDHVTATSLGNGWIKLVGGSAGYMLADGTNVGLAELLRPVSAPQKPTSAPSGRKLRVLCLHGQWNNSAILQKQLSSFSNLGPGVDDLVEFTFLEAPNPSDPHEIAKEMPASLQKLLPGPYADWWQKLVAEDGSTTYKGVERSLECARAKLQEGFDGILGFSQGGALATMLLLQHANSGLADLPLRFCWLVCARCSRHPSFAPLVEQAIAGAALKVPSLIFHCGQDERVPREEALKVARMFDASASTVLHFPDGRHMVPRLGEGQLAEVRAFLAAQLGQAP